MFENQGEQVALEKTSVARSNKVRDKLLALKRNLEDELSNVNAAIGALDANPGFEEIYDTLNKVVRRL